MKVALLCGGVGGAKLARGLQDELAPGDLTVIGNVGDDVEVLGLHVSPDLDSVLYALAGLNDAERGWGRATETWRTLESAAAWGGDVWFRLGDLDLGLHLVRTQALREGQPLSTVTARLAAAAGLATHLLPATDDPLRTFLRTPAGELPFQEWFVARGHRDEVDDVRFEGAENAAPAPGVLEAIDTADRIVIAPSNPYVSIWPILAVAGIRAALVARRASCIAVSPLIGGRAVKGPLDRMLPRMAGGTTPSHVADRYTGLIDALVIDEADAPAVAAVPLHVTSTLMDDVATARRLACVGARGCAVKVAVIGGTGSFGLACARRLKEAGHEVVIGSRDAARAAAAAAELGVGGATNADAAASADLVLLATKADAALETARELSEAVGTTPILSVAAELRFTPAGVLPAPEPTSLAERIQEVVDGPVVAGLHSLAARNLGGDEAPEEDALVCGDDADAKAVVLELAQGLTSGRAIDCGPLASARALEGLTAVIVNVNKRYKAHAGIRVTGLR